MEADRDRCLGQIGIGGLTLGVSFADALRRLGTVIRGR